MLVIEEVKLTTPVEFSQKTKSCGLNCCMTGFGLTVIVYVPGWLPAQLCPFKLIVGVMVTVAVIGAAPEFMAVKLGMVLAVPEVGVNPIALLLTDQLNVAGLTVELKALAATIPCVQMVTLDKFCI